jgi:hypothetical protein
VASSCMTMTMVVPLFVEEVERTGLKTGHYEGVGASRGNLA